MRNASLLATANPRSKMQGGIRLPRRHKRGGSGSADLRGLQGGAKGEVGRERDDERHDASYDPANEPSDLGIYFFHFYTS